MILHVKGSNKAVRRLIETAAWFYAEKLMGKRLMESLEITINLKRGMLEKTGNEATAIWEDDNVRPKEFTIDIDSGVNLRNLLITLAHEMVHVKQWAKDEMYEYTNMAGLVRFKGEKGHMEITEYWAGTVMRFLSWMNHLMMVLKFVMSAEQKQKKTLYIL